MRWISLCGVLWIAVALAYAGDAEDRARERTADSETVEGKVWGNLISRCASEGNFLTGQSNGLWDGHLRSLPEGAQTVARRARRCQDRVRMRLNRAAAQCLDEESVRALRRRSANNPEDRDRYTMNAVFDDCKDQYYDLLESLHDCCTVIPGY